MARKKPGERIVQDPVLRKQYLSNQREIGKLVREFTEKDWSKPGVKDEFSAKVGPLIFKAMHIIAADGGCLPEAELLN